MTKRQPPENIAELLSLVSTAYSYRINACGATAKGVFWKDEDAQILRLELLLQAIKNTEHPAPVTVNDLGCGYGVLYDLLMDQRLLNGGTYYGYDISHEMVARAQSRHNAPNYHIEFSPVATQTADYSFVSGTYNMNLGAQRDIWTDYVKTNLQNLWAKTTQALAFNMLDNTCPMPIDDLYYADKTEFVEFALSLSPDIELIDDYPLDEFTIHVNRF